MRSAHGAMIVTGGPASWSRRGCSSLPSVVAVLVALVALVALAVLGPVSPAAAEPGSLGGGCVTMAGAGRAVCRPPGLPPAREPALPVSPSSLAGGIPSAPRDGIGYADFAAAYSIYRLVSASDEQRRCRLQPTCSLFAARAARRFGLLRGLLMGFARAQMSHSDQGGFLPRSVASDGKFIFLDPVERWDHGDDQVHDDFHGGS